MSELKIIITMAGEGTRFSTLGFEKPKFMIEARNISLFEWAVMSLSNFFEYEFIFISQKKHNAGSFVSCQCKNLNIKNYNLLELSHPTSGQAETVLKAEDHLDPSAPLLIYNIDTYAEPEFLNPSEILGDGWIPSFSSKGTHWSFVKFNKNKKVEDIAEKIRISEYATIGLYYFGSFKIFKDCYESFDFKTIKEKYIAPMYLHLIKNKPGSVYTHIIPADKVHSLGTPEEVSLFDPDFGKIIEDKK
jgi:choline kinase